MLKLEVGKSYLNRNGEIVKIVTETSHHDYPFDGDDGEAYTPNGRWCVRNGNLLKDLVSEVKDKKTSKPHKWAKEIKAWADGAKIEYRRKYDSLPVAWWCDWKIAEKPQWYENSLYEYRIALNPDYELRGHLSEEGIDWSGCDDCTSDNIVSTFDGVTKQLKKVEML